MHRQQNRNKYVCIVQCKLITSCLATAIPLCVHIQLNVFYLLYLFHTIKCTSFNLDKSYICSTYLHVEVLWWYNQLIVKSLMWIRYYTIIHFHAPLPCNQLCIYSESYRGMSPLISNYSINLTHCSLL